MLPTEFAVRMIAADQRFSQALRRDDVREMRAALAEKTELLQLYFAASRQGAHDGRKEAGSATSLQ
jgi:hypothetical protein